MWNAEFNLYLYSESPCAPKDFESLHDALLKRKFIGEKISSTAKKRRYQTGDQFLSLLSFMGCSPNIELEPQEDKPYCYIEIENTQADAAFISGINLRKYPCPACKQRIKTIGELINTALDRKAPSLNCPHCNHHIDYKNINWRKTGFIAKDWIVVGNIYESEAIPGDNLLNSLEKVTGSHWKFAYIRTEKIKPVIPPG